MSSEPGADSRTMKSHPVPLEVPVVATGARPGDQSEKRALFTEETETVLVLEHGAVIRLSAAVAAGQLVFLTNKQSGKEVVTQVLRKRSFRPTSCYVELDFTEPAPDFWGVEFSKTDTDAKADLLPGEAAEIAEAEVTEEEFEEHTPPDAAEVARLRREVEALKAQLKSQQTTTTDHASAMQPPSASDLENRKSLLGPKKAAEESPEEGEKGQTAKAPGAKLEIMSPNEPKPEPVTSEGASSAHANPAPDQTVGQASSYPIRMQLPRATGASNRASEFAADSAAITHAIEDHLLPKTNLDFEKFRGVAEPKTKLFSGKATRSLSGPIGAMIAAVLLLIAAGIMAFQFGWYPKFGRKSPKSDASKSAFPPSEVTAPAPANVEPEPPANVSTAKSGAPPRSSRDLPPSHAFTSSKPDAPVPTAEVESPHTESSPAKSSVRPTPDKRAVKGVAVTNNAAPASPSIASKGEDVFVPPKLVKAIKSLSPPEALWRYTSGNVVLDALVNETGHVESATVISGPKPLHQRAITTVKEYLYQPATRNGKPVPAHVQVKIQFWYEP